MISYPVERQVDILEFAVQFLYSISPPNHDYFPLHNDDGTAAMSVAGIVFFQWIDLYLPPSSSSTSDSMIVIISAKLDILADSVDVTDEHAKYVTSRYNNCPPSSVYCRYNYPTLHRWSNDSRVAIAAVCDNHEGWWLSITARTKKTPPTNPYCLHSPYSPYDASAVGKSIGGGASNSWWRDSVDSVLSWVSNRREQRIKCFNLSHRWPSTAEKWRRYGPLLPSWCWSEPAVSILGVGKKRCRRESTSGAADGDGADTTDIDFDSSPLLWVVGGWDGRRIGPSYFLTVYCISDLT